MTPWEGCKAVWLSVWHAIAGGYGAVWVTLFYFLLAGGGLWVLAKMNEVAEEHFSHLAQRDVFAAVLAKAHDQSARFLVTFTITFCVYTFNLSLGYPVGVKGADFISLSFLRAFPSIGFAAVQLYSLWRWRALFVQWRSECPPVVIAHQP